MSCWGRSVGCRWSWRFFGFGITRCSEGVAGLGVSATLAQPKKRWRPWWDIVTAPCSGGHHQGNPHASTMPQAFARLRAGHIGLQLLDEVAAVVEAHRSTLIFTNTRRQAEVWYQALLDYKPEWAGRPCIMIHLARAQDLVEDACMTDGSGLWWHRLLGWGWI